jgi:hypothetical protein
MISFNDNTKSIIDDIIVKNIPNKVDKIIHVNPREQMKVLVYHLISEGLLPLNKKSITLICKEWKTLLYKKYSIFN